MNFKGNQKYLSLKLSTGFVLNRFQGSRLQFKPFNLKLIKILMLLAFDFLLSHNVTHINAGFKICS